jgi:hypothetical protein
MKIEIEFPGVYRDFYTLRRELGDRGEKFTDAYLQSVPYSQLHLCCIGNAGGLACTLKSVQQEKLRRRERFLSMEMDEFRAVENYLKIEQMYDDVKSAIEARLTPTWDSLNDRQKACAKLICLYNHVDNPQKRMGEMVVLLRRCSTNQLPADVAGAYMVKLKGLLSVFPGKLSDETFRSKIADITDNLLNFLPDQERSIIDREEIQDYRCTSDCFRVF